MIMVILIIIVIDLILIIDGTEIIIVQCQKFGQGGVHQCPQALLLHPHNAHTQQTDLATKQRKSQKTTTFGTKQCKIQQNTINCTPNERDFSKFLHICHVKKFEITRHVEKFQISPHLSGGEM